MLEIESEEMYIIYTTDYTDSRNQFQLISELKTKVNWHEEEINFI